MNCIFSTNFKSGKLRGRHTNFKNKILSGIKIHTMRDDDKDRWRVGMMMQMVYWPYSPQRDNFCNEPCVSIQSVTFDYSSNAVHPKITIDGREISIIETIMLAANEGFDSLDEFVQYFNESKTIKLLHWTPFTYDGNIEVMQKRHDFLHRMQSADISVGPVYTKHDSLTYLLGGVQQGKSRLYKEWLKGIEAGRVVDNFIRDADSITQDCTSCGWPNFVGRDVCCFCKKPI